MTVATFRGDGQGTLGRFRSFIRLVCATMSLYRPIQNNRCPSNNIFFSFPIFWFIFISGH